MNLNKECLSCGEFFPAEPMEFKFFCNKVECQKIKSHDFQHIKQSRHIPSRYFDIYDLDRPLISYDGKIVPNMYERVCRICGKPLLRKKDGKYSYNMRYCRDHNGSELWAKYNWGLVSKSYAYNIQEKNKKKIKKKFYEEIKENNSYYKEKSKEWIKRKLNNLIICEECGKLCQITNDYYWDKPNLRKYGVINIHHIIPVHTLTWDNLHLIWDKSNLFALCEDCHNQQDHHLKQFKEDPFVKFKKITEFIY